MSESRRRIPRWQIGLAASVALVAASLLTARPAFVLAAAIPVVYMGISNLTAISSVEVAVEREIEPERPAPGDRVTVTLTIRNVGESPIPDLRVVDSVPDRLEVVDGTPRAFVGLRTDEETSVTYVVVAKRGEHEFGSPRVRARSASATTMHTDVADAVGVESFRCQLALESMPIREQTIQYVGQVPTDTAGDGVEFYSTREYRASDPRNRINWRRYAETGDLSTVQYRQHRAATVVFVIDAREEAERAISPGQPSAVELSLYAVDRSLRLVRENGNRVGVAAIGHESDLIEPSRARTAESRFESMAESISNARDSGAYTDGGTDRRIRAVCKQLPTDAQVVFTTPLLDDFPLRALDTFRAYGHEVTILSPDVTGGETVGHRLEAVRRDVRLTRVRERGASVVDWDVTEPLSVAVAEALERWVKR